MITNCLGLDLSAALKEYQKNGMTPVVQYTYAPVKPGAAVVGEHGTPRVISIRGDVLVVSYFLDGPPSDKGLS